MTMIRSVANCVRRVNARCSAGLASLAHDESPVADAVRQEFTAHLAHERADADADDPHALSHMARSIVSAPGGAAGRSRDACQRRDRRRCLPSDRRGIGLARNGRSQDDGVKRYWAYFPPHDSASRSICSRCIAEAPLVPGFTLLSEENAGAGAGTAIGRIVTSTCLPTWLCSSSRLSPGSVKWTTGCNS